MAEWIVKTVAGFDEITADVPVVEGSGELNFFVEGDLVAGYANRMWIGFEQLPDGADVDVVVEEQIDVELPSEWANLGHMMPKTFTATFESEGLEKLRDVFHVEPEAEVAPDVDPRERLKAALTDFEASTKSFIEAFKNKAA